ncbi:MAG: hypothetical protein ACK5LZ_06665 [Anaerorhabdus sp.]
MENFIYSLRLGIDPKTWDKQKQYQLEQFIKAAKIDDVNIIINSEELNQGHIPLSETQKWLDVSKVIQDELQHLNVTLSLNAWCTLQHCDRGRIANDDLNFKTMVDYQGVSAHLVACPNDANWQSYIASTFECYAAIHPRYIWLDDDFRHFNHTPVQWGCFCSDHMKLYSEQLGYTITREEFVKKILTPNTTTLERLVYLRQAQKEMLDVAKKINAAVSKISSDTILGLMSSEPQWHQIENRNWSLLLETLCNGHPKTNRPHLPAYNEKAGLHYIRDFNRITRVTADMAKEDTHLFPELENYMYSPYAKSNAFTQLQLETCALVGACGVQLNFYDMMGNGVVEDYRHQDILAQSKPFLNFLVANRININQLDGIKVLYAQDSVSTRHLLNSTLDNLLPKEFEWLALLSSFGIACRPMDIHSKENLVNEVVACSDQVLRNLSVDEIEQLFLNNIVLLDGSSAAILFEYNLEHLIHATSITPLEPHSSMQTYEEISSDTALCGVNHARMTMMQQCGTYFNISYEKEVTIISKTYNEFSSPIGNGMACSPSFFIIPIAYHPQDGWDGQYINYKAEVIKNFLSSSSSVPFLKNTSVVQFIKENDKLILTNFSLDAFDNIQLVLPSYRGNTLHIKLTTRQTTHDFFIKELDGVYTLPYPLAMYETIYLKIV